MMIPHAGFSHCMSIVKKAPVEAVSRFAEIQAAATEEQYDRAFGTLRELEFSEMAALGVSAESYAECWGWDDVKIHSSETVGTMESRPMAAVAE